MLNDIRYALRTLRQNPGFAATAVVSIALAVGANSAIFSLADAVVLRPLPIPNASSGLLYSCGVASGTADRQVEARLFHQRAAQARHVGPCG